MDVRNPISKDEDAAMRIGKKARELSELIRHLVPAGDARAEALAHIDDATSCTTRALFEDA